MRSWRMVYVHPSPKPAEVTGLRFMQNGALHPMGSGAVSS